MQSILVYEDLLFKRYAYAARGPEAYDCYGLVMECYRRLGTPIADYPSPGNRAEGLALMLRAAQESWIQEPKARPGITVTFVIVDNTRVRRAHIGFMLDEDRFLHALDEAHGIFVERVSSPLWRRQITGFYSWKG